MQSFFFCFFCFFCFFHLPLQAQGEVVPEIQGFRYLQHNSAGYAQYQQIGSSPDEMSTIPLLFVWIPKGAFLQGSPLEEKGREAEEMQSHPQEIFKDFLISETEVTQEVWEKVMQTTPWRGQIHVQENPQAPVTYVSWEDCQKFCEKTGLKLPTEAQWEYACRGKTKSPYFWGEVLEESYLWYQGNTWDQKKPYPQNVREKKANPFGLYDMLGNVWEWCQEEYPLQEKFLPSGSVPLGEETKFRFYVNRGGSFLGTPLECRCAVRNFIQGHRKGFALGFRVVYELPE